MVYEDDGIKFILRYMYLRKAKGKISVYQYSDVIFNSYSALNRHVLKVVKTSTKHGTKNGIDVNNYIDLENDLIATYDITSGPVIEYYSEDCLVSVNKWLRLYSTILNDFIYPINDGLLGLNILAYHYLDYVEFIKNRDVKRISINYDTEEMILSGYGLNKILEQENDIIATKYGLSK